MRRHTRVRAARTADEWKGAGDHAGLSIWRIEQFKVKPVPKNEYGNFFDGDSYIVLNTVIDKNGKKSYDIHFWLGKLTSIDEMGVAAYKTVELDDLLGTLPKEHREVQGTESDLFLSYFQTCNKNSGLRVVHGGTATGFTHVDSELEKGRSTASDKGVVTLWHVKGRKNVRVYEVSPKCASLNKGDAFILDARNKIFVWVGEEASPQEKYKTATVVTAMQDDRSDSAQVFHVGAGSKNERDLKAEEEFFSLLKGSPSDVQNAIPDNASLIPQEAKQKRLFRVSDASGSIVCTLVGEGDQIQKSLLNENDVFILDSGLHVFIWVGDKSSKQEKTNAMPLAINYVAKRGYLPNVPITREVEGLESQQFLSALSK
ncbi:hypothetical protein C9374_001059 [Naegleria lovaniensis]|uniref:Gelsolin-like domain-containing protein n=1 Tax=Naegleria lovaniensis TaxID=51637 RepID=A0AA88KNN7_NAELO|nr:uncharacterized protein C9374_001059 [Naegleria lovaniensis]KAG2388209.1 hypothetical protein C9374_001059 [Naegleria lovaniensis]